MLPHSTPPLFAWFEVTLHTLACYIAWLLVQVFETRCSGKVHLHRIQEDVEQCIDVLELQLYAVVCFPPSPRRIKFVPHWYRPHSFERESPQRCVHDPNDMHNAMLFYRLRCAVRKEPRTYFPILRRHLSFVFPSTLEGDVTILGIKSCAAGDAVTTTTSLGRLIISPIRSSQRFKDTSSLAARSSVRVFATREKHNLEGGS